MPIYEYRCRACGHELEALQKLSESPLAVCPECNASALTKLVSAAGFQLKGTGWYVTDFKSSGGKPQSKAKDDPGASSDGDAKSDGKPESKKESTTDSTKAETKSDTKGETTKPVTAASTGTPAADK